MPHLSQASFHPVIRDWFAESFGEPSALFRAFSPRYRTGKRFCFLPGCPYIGKKSWICCAVPATSSGSAKKNKATPNSTNGAKFARKPGNYQLLQNDRWLYWIENNGKKVYRMADGNRNVALLAAVFHELLRRQKKTKIVVEQWNGEPAIPTEEGQRLLAEGGERDMKAIVFWSNR